MGIVLVAAERPCGRQRPSHDDIDLSCTSSVASARAVRLSRRVAPLDKRFDFDVPEIAEPWTIASSVLVPDPLRVTGIHAEHLRGRLRGRREGVAELRR